nr:hypothetical protein [Desulforamulus aquiferis]
MSKSSGEVTRVTANEIVIKTDDGRNETHKLLKFTRSNQAPALIRSPLLLRVKGWRPDRS